VITDAGTTVLVERVQRAINAHDLEGLMACFAADVRSEQPTRPDRGFHGRDELRSYWEQVLSSEGDFHADLLRAAGDAHTAWAEWCWTGTRADGSRFARAGVTIYGVEREHITWVRLYMEPVQGEPDSLGRWMVSELGRRAPD
jgi:ketosteroid isomerase-like protein